jgi:predicted transcriptional regulator
MKRRSKPSRMLEILQCIRSGGAKISAVVRACNISHTEAVRDCQILAKAGLLAEENGEHSRKYKITPQGFRLLSSSDELIRSWLSRN